MLNLLMERMKEIQKNRDKEILLPVSDETIMELIEHKFQVTFYEFKLRINLLDEY